MFKLSLILSILKYSGLVLASGSTLWGLTHELYTKDDEGKRHLTRAGRYSVALVILGLLVSLNTTTLESILKDRATAEVEAKVQREKQEKALERLEQLQRQEAKDQQEREDRQRDREDAQAREEKRREDVRQQRETILDSAQRASIEGALREQRESRRTLAQHTTELREISRLLQPIDEVKVEGAVLFPRDSEYSAYLRRVDQVVDNYLHGLPGEYRFSSQKTTNGQFVTELIRIEQESPIYPGNSREECTARFLATSTAIVISLRRSPFDLSKLSEVEVYSISDLELIATAQTNSGTAPDRSVAPVEPVLEYDVSTRRLAAVVELKTRVDQESWDNNGKIVSVADLPGSQMFLNLHVRGSCVPGVPGQLKMPPAHELVKFVMRIGRRQFSIDMKFFQKVRDKRGSNYYVITFPESEEEFRKLTESGEDIAWYSR